MRGVGHWFDDNVRRVVGDGKGTLFWYDNWIGDIPLRLKFPKLFDLAMFKEVTVEARVGGRGIGVGVETSFVSLGGRGSEGVLCFIA